MNEATQLDAKRLPDISYLLFSKIKLNAKDKVGLGAK